MSREEETKIIIWKINQNLITGLYGSEKTKVIEALERLIPPERRYMLTLFYVDKEKKSRSFEWSCIPEEFKEPIPLSIHERFVPANSKPIFQEFKYRTFKLYKKVDPNRTHYSYGYYKEI